jgi:outer membrane lipoprotein-sorting protein
VTTVQRGAFTIILVAVIAAGGFGAYKWVQSRINRSVTAPALPTNSGEVFSAPPFATKEPDRYQAMRVITTVVSEPDGVQAEPKVTRVAIARNGDKRREDYDADTDFRTSYLEIPEGTFVVLYAKKVYAEIKASGNAAAPSQPVGEQSDSGADFSLDILLNEANSARYEKLGSENLDGHTVTKYRVTGATGRNETAATTVTLIWIDEALAIPIKSETEVSDGSHRSKVTTELRDIQLQVDLKLFALPPDFKRVETAQLRDLLMEMQAAAHR